MVLLFRKMCAYHLLVLTYVSYMKRFYVWLSSFDVNKQQFKFNIR